MMNILTVDRFALPQALLTRTKAHMRVEYVRDDALILDYLSQGIAAIERRCNINLNPSVYDLDGYELRLESCSPSLYRYRLPVNNVGEVIDVIQDGGANVAASYTITQSDQGGSGNSYLVGPQLSGSGWALKVAAGVSDPVNLDAAVIACLYRIAAAYNEARESNAPVFVDEFTSELVSVWRPSV